MPHALRVEATRSLEGLEESDRVPSASENWRGAKQLSDFDHRAYTVW